MEENTTFVVEGEITLGPYKYPIFVDQKVLGPTLLEYFQPQKSGITIA
jgi:hypothetical protein